MMAFQSSVTFRRWVGAGQLCVYFAPFTLIKADAESCRPFISTRYRSMSRLEQLKATASGISGIEAFRRQAAKVEVGLLGEENGQAERYSAIDTKESITRFLPPLLKSTSSLFLSISAMIPMPNF